MVLRASAAPYWLCEDPRLHFWMPAGALDFAWSVLRGRAACDTEGQGKDKQALILNDGQPSFKRWHFNCALMHQRPGNGNVISFTTRGQHQGKGSGWQLPATVWENSEPWHNFSPLPPWPISQSLVTSFLTWIWHQLWLSLGILIMGRNALVKQASQSKEGAQEGAAKFSNRGACSEALIWTVPLSSTLAVSPAGLWWQHAPALKHRAQWQHQNNSRVNKSWRYATFRGACFVSLPNHPSYGCCLQIHPLGKQFGWAKVFKRDAKLTIKIT